MARNGATAGERRSPGPASDARRVETADKVGRVSRDSKCDCASEAIHGCHRDGRGRRRTSNSTDARWIRSQTKILVRIVQSPCGERVELPATEAMTRLAQVCRVSEDEALNIYVRGLGSYLGLGLCWVAYS